MMIVDGWFFDAYPIRGGMLVWIVTAEGKAVHGFDPFSPSFYLRLDAQDEKRLPGLVQTLKLPVVLGTAQMTELFSGEEVPVTRVTVHDPLLLNRCVWSLQKYFPHFAFSNSNIPVAQLYLYDRRIFPLARCRCTLSSSSGGGERRTVERLEVDDTPGPEGDYQIPDLRVMRLINSGGGGQAAKFARTLTLELAYDARTYVLEQEHPRDVLEALNGHLYRYDPDIIISSWGDAALFPALLQASARYRIPLLLNRDRSQRYLTTEERSYWTYGQVFHSDAAVMLSGRWHMDSENSFIMGEADLEGVLELARMTQLPVQKQSRAAIGTGLASMQMSYAYRNNILIPAEKKEGEDFKTADELLLSDRGGLVFLPEPGCHEHVAELDFASMYPTLMEIHNISPETVNCACRYCRRSISSPSGPPARCSCDSSSSDEDPAGSAATVPELGYTICRRRRGIVPATLKPVLERRAYYKARKKAAASHQEYQKYDRRQNALKWMLVTCFGYLGYKNARFGRIEAHESVNAFAREALLTAKEIAEEKGFHLVHAIVDCLWLKKPGATQHDYEQLCATIKSAIGVTMSLEGIYRWILFPSSKIDPALPTAGKYVGWYEHGEIKVRGIEMRRRDTPLYIKKAQGRLLEMMSALPGTAAIQQHIPELLREAGFYLNELRSGRADAKELVVRRRVRKEAGEYTQQKSLHAMVVRELAQFGVDVHPGEVIEYIIIDQTGKREPQKAKSLLTYQHEDGYDTEKYGALLLKAVETLLSPFGYDTERLEAYYRQSPQQGERKNASPGRLPPPPSAQLNLLLPGRGSRT